MKKGVSLYILISTLFVVFINVGVFVSWQFTNPSSSNAHFNLINVNPFSAFMFLLIAVWVLIKNKKEDERFKHALIALAVIIVGAVLIKLTALFSLHHFQIDRQMFRSKIGQNQMAKMSAINFLLLGLPMLFRKRTERLVYVFNFFSLAVMFISLVFLITFIINDPVIFKEERFIPMSIYSSISFVLLSIATVLVEAEKSFMRTFLSARMGGLSARRLFPYAVILPILLTSLRSKFQDAGIYNESLGIALHDVLIIFILLTIVWNTTRSLNRIDRQRSEAEEGLKKKSDNLLQLVEELKEKNQILDAVLKNLPVIVYRISATGIVTESVGSGLKLLGLKDREAIGMNVYQVQPQMRERVKTAIENGFSVVESLVELNNNKAVFETYIFPDDLNPGGALCFSIDNTEKKKVEKVLQEAKQNAETASYFKTRFLANMSHEIRTPLNAILGFAEILKSANIERNQQLEYLNHIETSGSMLLKLIGDVLDISKIEEGKLSINNEPFSFAETIQSAVRPYKFKANEKGLDFSLMMDPDIPPFLVGDAHRVNQILINLLGNALKFTKEGKISVAIAQLRSHTKDKVLIQFSIQDTGIGIADEKQSAIFESFTQADSSIVREYGGSGLGLAIVKQLITLMGGSISVKTPQSRISDKGGLGSLFEFTIPLTLDESNNNQKKNGISDDDKENFSGLKVLVAEDNLLNQKLANHMLTKIGCSITIASNGKEAIEKLLEANYDLVFMDVQMPVMDGLRATELIRKDINRTIPVIGLTANVFKDDIESCLSAGMNDHLGKPYTETQLKEKVNKWCFNKKSVVPAA